MSQGKPNRERDHSLAGSTWSPHPPHPCEEIESLAVLYVCDELEPGGRAALEAHAAGCPACASVLARERRLHAAIAGFDQSADSLDRSGLLLAQCRSELAEALRARAVLTARPRNDRLDLASRTRWRAIFSPAEWWRELRDTLVYHPAMGVGIAVLVVAAFLAGHWSQRFRVPPPGQPTPAKPTLNASDAPAFGEASAGRPKLTDEQLRSADRAHVEWVTRPRSGAPTVQVQLMSQTPLETPLNIVGAPSDQDVERALTYLLENSQRFDPGTLVDSLDVLRTRASDPGVRRTLCAAARGDADPGVRIKALEALQGFEWDPMVHETLLDALQSDDSSWVRAEAINLLVSALRSDSGAPATADTPSPDAVVLGVLRDRLRNDPSPYVRAQSAAALRQLGQL